MSNFQPRLNPEIDSMRALAVTGVLLYHFFPNWFPGGFLGVDIFFVISGYVVTRTSIEQTDKPIFQFLKYFWMRRFWRVFPPVLGVVCLGGLLVVLVDPIPFNTLRTALFGIVGLANVEQFVERTDYFVELQGTNAFAHLWSLGVEEQFYLIFPVVLFASKRTRSRWAGPTIVLVLLALSILSAQYVTELGRPEAAFYLLPFRFWQLSAGAILAMILGDSARSFGRIGVWVKFVCVTTLTCQFLINRNFAQMSSVVAVMGSIAIILMIDFRRVHFPLWTEVTAAIGRRSYSLYLIHWPLLVLFRLTVGTASALMLVLVLLTVSLSEVSYRLVELPFRRMRWNRPAIKAHAIVAIVAIVLLLAVSVTQRNFLYTGHRQDESSIIKRHECARETSSRWLVGDSHANGYANILSLSFDGDCRQLRNSITGDFFLFQLVGANPRTVVFMDEAPFLESMSIERPTELWIINYLQGFFQDSDDVYPSADWRVGNYARPDGAEILGFQEALDFRIQQYRNVLAKARELGTSVYIELPPPDFNWVSQGGLEWHDESQMCSSNWFSPNRESRFSDICRLYKTPAVVARSIVEKRRLHIVQGLINLADEFSNLRLIDPLGAICTAVICSTHLNGQRIFEDDDHYSVMGEELIATRLMSLIK